MNGIAKNIKKLRQRKGLTQEELGEKLHVTWQAVSNWETGKNQPDIKTLTSLAAFFEVDIKELLYGPTPDEGRPKRKWMAVILCSLAVISWAICLPLGRYAEYMVREHSVAQWRFLYRLVINPAVFFLLGTAISSLFFLGRSRFPIQPAICRGILAAAILFCFLHGWMVLHLFWAVPIPRGLFFFFLTDVCWDNSWIFLLVGILFFVSENGVKAQERKSG